MRQRGRCCVQQHTQASGSSSESSTKLHWTTAPMKCSLQRQAIARLLPGYCQASASMGTGRARRAAQADTVPVPGTQAGPSSRLHRRTSSTGAGRALGLPHGRHAQPPPPPPPPHTFNVIDGDRGGGGGGRCTCEKQETQRSRSSCSPVCRFRDNTAPLRSDSAEQSRGVDGVDEQEEGGGGWRGEGGGGWSGC